MKIKVKSLKNSTNVNKRITTTESEGPIKKFKVSNTNQFIECAELQIWVNGTSANSQHHSKRVGVQSFRGLNVN